MKSCDFCPCAMPAKRQYCSNVLDRHVFEESLSGGVQAMLLSDCGFLVYENALRAALAAANLMRAFITRGVPLRMGLARGTFYDMEYETNATDRESHVVSKSRFYGTAVIHAHAAEQCGACASFSIVLSRKTSPSSATA